LTVHRIDSSSDNIQSGIIEAREFKISGYTVLLISSVP